MKQQATVGIIANCLCYFGFVRSNKLEFKHIPVLLNETINGLNINPNGIYVDGTIGGAGHSKKIIKELSSTSSIKSKLSLLP